jgi:hypothetical protein
MLRGLKLAQLKNSLATLKTEYVVDLIILIYLGILLLFKMRVGQYLCSSKEVLN